MATQVVRISNEVEIPYLTYNGQAVLTFALIDKVHNRVEGTASRNFRSNRQRFIAGEDYFYITDSQGLDEFRRSHPGILKDAANEITLITESGYLMLVKSFTDDLSWQIQRQLVKLYFRVKEMAHTAPKPELIHPGQLSRLGDIIWCMARAFYMEGSVRHWLGKYVCACARVSRRDHIPASFYPEVEDFLQSIDRAVTAYREERIQHERQWLLLTLKRELDKRMGRLGPEFEMLAEDRKELAIKA